MEAAGDEARGRGRLRAAGLEPDGPGPGPPVRMTGHVGEKRTLLMELVK